NLLGYTNLAVFALKVASQGTDMSLSFSALLIVADGLIIGLIHNRFSRKPMVDPMQRVSLESKMHRFIRLAVGLLWIYYFLLLVDLYRPIYEAIDQFLAVPYKVGSITFTLGMLVTFVGILAISFAITSLISFLLDGKEVRMSIISLPKGIPSAISLVIRYFILAVGFVLALSSLGIDLSKFNLMAGALGLGIGFGLQTVVSNFISGIILVFERPILPGDVVEVNNLLGTVNKIGVRASRISTFDGSEVVVPNNNLISNDLINWTLSNNMRRIEILVGTSYKSDPNMVLEAMREVTSDHPLVLKYPAPIALFLEFGESSLNFRLLFWINIQNVLSARSEVSIALYNRFKELGIKIPYPQRVVHLPESDPDNVHPQDE
ncbi:MAG: mechanosensitive ion channel domain-containing protein, partial [Flavobacteriaceae bacterium]